MEINGFEIDKYNQYGFSESAKASTCPVCSHNRKKSTDKCMTLHWDTGLGVCHHCGDVIQLHTFKKKDAPLKVYNRPEWKNNTVLSDKVVQWFEGRGISQFTLRLMRISEGKEWMPQVKKEQNTIQFNYFRDAELINIKYRDGAKNFKLVSGAELIFYNLDCIKYSDSCIIVEGEMDALSFVECGLHNVVSVPNGSTLKSVNLEYLDNCIDYFENKKKIYLALDNDTAGQNVQKELIRRLGSNRCYTVDFSAYKKVREQGKETEVCKDANDVLKNHNKDTLLKTIADAIEIPIDGVSSVNDFRDSFENYLVNGMQQGFKIGKPFFDTKFSTYTGQYIVVTGIPSHGKSDFVDEMVLGYVKKYGWKSAFCSPENKPNEIHAGKVIAKLCGTWINYRNQIEKPYFNKAVQYMNDNIKYIDMDGHYELDAVLSKAERLIFKYGIKVLVIDPYNKIRLERSVNKNINDYTNDYLLTIDEFARKHDILIILVAHPRKPTLQEGKTYEPNFYDIKGGGEFYDMSPHGLLVHRDFTNDLIKIKVLKCKFSHLGENNAFVYMRWNKNNGRFMEFESNYQNPEECGAPMFDETNYFNDVQPESKPLENYDPFENNDFLLTEEVPF